jgi:hypothetical protein
MFIRFIDLVPNITIYSDLNINTFIPLYLCLIRRGIFISATISNIELFGIRNPSLPILEYIKTFYKDIDEYKEKGSK